MKVHRFIPLFIMLALSGCWSDDYEVCIASKQQELKQAFYATELMQSVAEVEELYRRHGDDLLMELHGLFQRLLPDPPTIAELQGWSDAKIDASFRQVNAAAEAANAEDLGFGPDTFSEAARSLCSGWG